MNEAILELLKALRAIDADHDGLGDTIVRDFMTKEIFDGFLKPIPGFRPSGEYDMSKEANRLVAEAIGSFCKKANAAAKREGLKTFQQRLAAFQNSKITLPGNVNYNDYFGYVPAANYDENGDRKPDPKPKKSATVRRGLIFDLPGGIEKLLKTLNKACEWKWKEIEDSMGDPLLECTPRGGAKVQIREGLECMEPDGSITPPEYAFMALLEAPSGDIEAVEGIFRALLKKVKATNVAEKSDYHW